MMEPPGTSCPPKAFMPSRCAFESRPFLELPNPFLCAMRTSFQLSAIGCQLKNLWRLRRCGTAKAMPFQNYFFLPVAFLAAAFFLGAAAFLPAAFTLVSDVGAASAFAFGF